MVADSTTDSRLLRGSPIWSDVFKKRKATLLMKLKHFKVNDARRSRQWKRANDVVEEVEEAFDDASDDDSSDDDYSDAFNMFKEEDPSESESKTEEAATDDDQKKEEDDDEDYCPLCDEEMDATDLSFKPCSSCEYKMCLFCYTRINEKGAGVCHGCRKKYEQQNSGEVSFQQQSGGDPLPLSSSFQGLDSDSDKRLIERERRVSMKRRQIGFLLLLFCLLP